MTTIAKHIIVDRDDRGAPRLQIDGFVFDFATAGITVPAPSLDQVPTVTVTFVAEKVTMLNDSDFAERLPAVAGPPYRCGHRGCGGFHDTAHESCC